jgi:DnaJ-class molecular chaperone
LRNPYAVLGLKPDADAAAIKAAYRRLAKTYHPDAQATDKADKNSDTQKRFQEVTAAYNLLKDQAARMRFDAQSAAESEARRWARPNAKSNFTEAAFNSGGTPDAGADIFTELFGGIRDAGKRVFRARGDDRTYRLGISFLEAALGAKKRIGLSEDRTVDVRVPAGIEEGQQIRLRGKGGEGFGGAPAGDALITVSIEPHEVLTRDGLNIFLELPISLTEAVLGGKVEVDTISGPVKLNIPAGSNTGTRLRLKGKGVKPADASRAGDQYVTLAIILPDEPDESLRDFAASWGAGLAHNPRKKGRS